MEDLIREYAKEIMEMEEFKRLLELKDIINKKYSLLIVSFKTKEANYNEAKERPEIFDLRTAQKEFQDAKIKLYSKDEVKEYFKLERLINERLESDMNCLKESISNKFLKTNSLKI